MILATINSSLRIIRHRDRYNQINQLIDQSNLVIQSQLNIIKSNKSNFLQQKSLNNFEYIKLFGILKVQNSHEYSFYDLFLFYKLNINNYSSTLTFETDRNCQKLIMNSLGKDTYKSIIKPIISTQRQLIFGISFKNPPNILTMFKEHFYSLFLLIYFYGEPEHKNKITNKFYEYELETILKIQEHKFKCISQNNRCHDARCLEKSKYNRRIKELKFIQNQLKKINGNAIYFHNIQDRELIRKSFLMIFEKQKKLSKTSNMSFIDFCILAGSLLGIDVTIKSYWNTNIIQFNCQLFKSKNIVVFIEINKNQKNYQYIKRYIYDDQGQIRYSQIKNNPSLQCNYLNNTLQLSQEFNNSYFYKLIKVEQSYLISQFKQQKKHNIMDKQLQAQSIDFADNNLEQIIEDRKEEIEQQKFLKEQRQNNEEYQQSIIQIKESEKIKYVIENKINQKQNLPKIELNNQQLEQQLQQSLIIQKQKQQIKYKKFQLQKASNNDLKQKQVIELQQNQQQLLYQIIEKDQIPVNKLQNLMQKQFKRIRKTSQQLQSKFIQQKFIKLNTVYKPNTNKILISTDSTINDNQSLLICDLKILKKQQCNDEGIIQQNSDTQPVQLQKLQNQILLQNIKKQDKKKQYKHHKKQRKQRKLSFSKQFQNMNSTIKHKCQDDYEDIDQSMFNFHSQFIAQKNEEDLNDRINTQKIQLNDFLQLLSKIQNQYQQFLNGIHKLTENECQFSSLSNIVKKIINQSIQENIQNYLQKIKYAKKKIQSKTKKCLDESKPIFNQFTIKKQNQDKINRKNKKRGQQVIKFPLIEPISHKQQIKNISKTILRQKGANLKEILDFQDEDAKMQRENIQKQKKRIQSQNKSIRNNSSLKSNIKASILLKVCEQNQSGTEGYDMSNNKVLKMSQYSPSKKFKQVCLKYSLKKLK